MGTVRMACVAMDASNADGDRADRQTDGGSGRRFTIASYGARIGFELCDNSLLDPILDALPAVRSRSAGGRLDRCYRFTRSDDPGRGDQRPRYDCYQDGELLWRAFPIEAAAVLEAHIEECIAAYARPWLFVHAGVVRWRGAAILLPGRSFAGKSTLVAALVAAGATYYSDEYAVLDADGRVVPFGRRLSLRDGPFGPAARIDLTHRGPDPASARRPLPVGLVALTEYRAGTLWQSEEISPAQGVRELCRHAMAMRRRPADAFATCTRVARSARLLQGTRGEADHAAAWLLQYGVQSDGKR